MSIQIRLVNLKIVEFWECCFNKRLEHYFFYIRVFLSLSMLGVIEVRQKYSATRRIFNSLLGVSSGDETLRLMFDILHPGRFRANSSVLLAIMHVALKPF